MLEYVIILSFASGEKSVSYCHVDTAREAVEEAKADMLMAGAESYYAAKHVGCGNWDD